MLWFFLRLGSPSTGRKYSKEHKESPLPGCVIYFILWQQKKQPAACKTGCSRNVRFMASSVGLPLFTGAFGVQYRLYFNGQAKQVNEARGIRLVIVGILAKAGSD